MSFFCLEVITQSNIGVVERFGKFVKTLDAGPNCVCWPIDIVVGKPTTRIQSLTVTCETKTKDDVFVVAKITVQYCIIDAKTSYYCLTNVVDQIKAYVYDVARSSIPTMELDEVFQNKDKISDDISKSLQETMEHYGYRIVQALVVDIEPDQRVKNAMNEINASRRWIQAASNKAEGDKILMVKAAEAEATAKFLSGQGVARQRAAIVAGLRDSIQDFSSHVDGATAADVMELLLLTQYFDMVKDIGSHESSKAIFLTKDRQTAKSVMEAGMLR